jgi:hypothetical protein
MARFKLTQAVAVSQYRFSADQIVADSQANAQPGDQIWNGLTAAKMIPGMQPLDGSATTMKAASIYANEPTVTSITGVDSINV